MEKDNRSRIYQGIDVKINGMVVLSFLLIYPPDLRQVVETIKQDCTCQLTRVPEIPQWQIVGLPIGPLNIRRMYPNPYGDDEMKWIVEQIEERSGRSGLIIRIY